MRLAYGNYGMPTMPYEVVVRDVAAIGYDGLELCVGANYPTAPEQLSPADRVRLRRTMQDAGLELAWLMVAGVRVPEPDPAQHQANLERLRRIFELGADLGSRSGIVVSTVGGRSDDWETQQEMLAERAGDWAQVAAQCGGTFAAEAHIGGLIDTPERMIWLLQEVGLPSLKVNFDYSHFEAQGIPLQHAVEVLIPHVVGTHVKDVAGRRPSFRFLLPGEGQVDYADYMRLLFAAGYNGYITVEVAGQVFKAPGYDALQAARYCYQVLSQALVTSGVPRG